MKGKKKDYTQNEKKVSEKIADSLYEVTGRAFRILGLLLTTRSSYKIITAALEGDYSKKQISNSLHRLKNRGLVTYNDGAWEITETGRIYYTTYTRYRYFDSPFTKKSKKDMLVIFDIPETDRSKRDWLRYQLKKFHYEQIQRSVWYGPSPLPKEFLDYLKELGIRDYLKIFKTRERV